MPERHKGSFEYLFNQWSFQPLLIIKIHRIPYGSIDMFLQLQQHFRIGADQCDFILVTETPVIEIGGGDGKYTVIDHHKFSVQVMRTIKQQADIILIEHTEVPVP